MVAAPLDYGPALPPFPAPVVRSGPDGPGSSFYHPRGRERYGLDVLHLRCSARAGSRSENGDMSEADIEYRRKAVVSIYHGGVLHQKTVAAPIELLFASETAADTYSLGMAKKWIDDNS